MQKIPVTTSGHARMEEELRNLKSVERPAIIDAISEARSHGDLSENAEYHAAREKQSFIEGRIQDLEDKISRADVFDTSKMSGNTIKFGATITVKDDDTKATHVYQIVGEYEADSDKGRLNLTAPLSRALIGKKAGDYVEVTTPKGTRAYEVLKIEYK